MAGLRAIFPRHPIACDFPRKTGDSSAAEAENPVRAGGSKPDGGGNMDSGCGRTNARQKSSARGRQLGEFAGTQPAETPQTVRMRRPIESCTPP